MHQIQAVCIFLFLVGCSKAPPPDDGTVSNIVATRTATSVAWRQGQPQDERTQTLIHDALSRELTADSAIQIALVNNPVIQATFEHLGIAQATLVEAGLFSNPLFGVEVRCPLDSGATTNIEYLITTSLLDIVLIPLRTRVATTEFEQTKLKVAKEILGLAFDVRATLYELVAERQKIRFLQSLATLEQIIGTIASKQRAAGTINTLESCLAESKALDAAIILSTAQADVVRCEERLKRFLGCSEHVRLVLPDDLPEDIPYHNPDRVLISESSDPSDASKPRASSNRRLGQYSNIGQSAIVESRELSRSQRDRNFRKLALSAAEALALKQRLDVQVARCEVERLLHMINLKAWWTYTDFQGGLAGEKEPNGTHLLGPGFSGQLPLCNYGQAARQRLTSRVRQAQDLVAELEIRVLSEVRQTHTLCARYFEIVQDYRNTLLPLQQTITASSEALYNVMKLGIDTLLENKKAEILANFNYTEAKKKWLLAMIELDRALDGCLPQLLELDGE